VARFDARFHRRAWRIVAASVVMGGVLLATVTGFDWAFTLPRWRYLALFGLIVLGAVSYFGAGQMLGAFRLGDLKRAMRRGGQT